MPKEYSDIKKSLSKAHPDWSRDKVAEMAARTFSEVFDISLQEADRLMKEGKWETWKKSHGFEKKSFGGLLEIKAFEDEHGRFIEYDVASTGSDRAMGITDGRLWYGDNLTEACILDMAEQLKSALGVIRDPESIRDIHELVVERPDWTGIGHEHSRVSKDIIPVTTTVDVKTVREGDNLKLRVVDKVNEYSSRANNFWNMLKEGILNYASIEFRPIEYYFKDVEGKTQRFVEKLKFFGKTYTGRPANGLCGVVNLSVKSVSVDDDGYDKLKEGFSKVSEEISMTSEEKKEDVKKEDAPVEKPVEKALEVANDEVKARDAEILRLKKELEEIKARTLDKALIDDAKISALIEAKFGEVKAQQKHLVEEEQKKFEEKASFVDSKLSEIKSSPTWETAIPIAIELGERGLLKYDF